MGLIAVGMVGNIENIGLEKIGVETDKGFISSIKERSIDDLPDGNVLIKIDYSSLNYKDALILKDGGKIVRKFPFVPGIDFSGKVVESVDDKFKKDETVICTGFRVGEMYYGGFSQYAKVDSNFLIKNPKNIDASNADTFLKSYSKNRLGLPHHLPKAKRIVYLFQSGGPSQLDMWDFKPKLKSMFGKDLPDSVRQGQRLTAMSAEQSEFPIAVSYTHLTLPTNREV